MKHPIDPKVDCVFKALLGNETNRNLLIHFLNAMLEGELIAPITEVQILNPYNDKEYLDDKLSIVDVKAKDQQQRIYQIEIQLIIRKHLPARILYNWTDLYSQQLQNGANYKKLNPTYSLWLLAEDLIITDNDYAHDYQLRDRQGNRLIAHGGIWILELTKFRNKNIATEQQRWLKFFQQAQQLDGTKLPHWMQTQEMRQAMATLEQFSEKERAYHAYQARQNYLREQRTIQLELEEYQRDIAQYQHNIATINQEKETERKAKEAAIKKQATERKAKEAALAEIEQLKALLSKHNTAYSHETTEPD